jgi:hypothetical protein
MYYMILAAMLTTNEARPPIAVPSVMGSYKTISECYSELEWMSEHRDFTSAENLLFGQSLVKQQEEQGVTVLFFCAKDMRGEEWIR